ncbi:MAG TPA: ABC transporter permease subunit [Streptosporangiaceae bacterium]|nr:ABC transporter permease subunit [Streptosporangiaceae bacterium]
MGRDYRALGDHPPGAARGPADAGHLGGSVRRADRAVRGDLAVDPGNTSWRNLFDTLPATYRALFTASGTIDLSTAGGYLGVELMGFMGPALIAVYAITAGSAAIAGEEDRGGLEITLSAPVSRVQLFGQRFAALLIGIATLMLASGAALWIFSAMLDMGLGVGAIASAAAGLGIFGLFTGAVAIAVGAATGSPAAARGVAALVAVASYLINALAQVASALRPARPISAYYLVLGNEPLAHGLRLLGAVSVLGAVAAIAAAGGILFARRDLS